MNSPDFHQLFEKVPALVIVLDPDFNIVAVSDLYLEAAKVTREKVLGKEFFQAFPEVPGSRDLGELRKSLNKVLQTKMPDQMAPQEYKMPHSKFWASINVPILGPNGEVQYIVRKAKDVTTIVHREGEHRTIEQERDLFFAHSFDLLAIVGTDGFFKRVNPAFERAMGYTEDELYARPISEFLHPEDVLKTKRGINLLASGETRIASVNRYRCKDGSYKWFSWNTTPMNSLLYTTGRDITAQIEAEEKIKQLNQELEKKNQNLEVAVQERILELRKTESQVLQLQKMDAVGRLAGGIAHDFNNLLGAITLYTDLIAENPGNDATANYAKDIREVTERAGALTRQLLVFSRKQVVQPKILSLNPLIEQLQRMLGRLLGEGFKLSIQLADDLKFVRVDPSQMEQVILNLTVNARDSMPSGGKISIETSNISLGEPIVTKRLDIPAGEYVLLTVTDHGVGMDLETQEKIFEPFFTTKPVGKGTGLGLTTVYGIIKQNKGAIWFYSEVGKGTVFKIYLPVDSGRSEPVVPVPEPLRKIQGNHTLLLIEDEEKLRGVFTLTLRGRGYQVLVAANGEQALEICNSTKDPIHLVITDVIMPGLNGFEVAKQLKALRPEIRILFMSGYTDDVFEQSGLPAISSGELLQKPFGASVLLAKVEEALK